MPLQSRLLRDNSALQACLVNDSAHVLQGARGPHVAKIQTALSILDGALMDEAELTETSYGPSTAAAVLAYKRARNIINRSYQQQADNIVGKMTIASLDREMVIGEAKPMPPSCKEPANGVSGGGAARLQIVSGNGNSLALVGDAGQQFPAIMSVLFQLVRVRGKLGPHSFAIVAGTLRRANELVQPFGMRVAGINGFSFAVPHKVKFDQPEEFLGLRKAAENAMPGFAAALRVIVCPFRKNDQQEDDLKTNAISMTVPGFDRFVAINSNLLRDDRGTLLHEMIHCSRPGLMGEIGVHEENDLSDIFSWGPNRTKLTAKHAEILQKDTFFSVAR